MNPSIPVISPENADIPYAERMNWSHVWLVDPLDGGEEFINHNGDFTVNIALIEGGKPVWGVVYIPLEDTVYYAKGASECCKIIGDGSTEILPSAEPSTDMGKTVVLSSSSNLAEDVKDYIDNRIKDYKLIVTGNAKALCLLAEGKATMHLSLGPTMEWETAAAHAIARSTGNKVYDYKTMKALAYNKESFINDSFIAE